LCKDSWDVKKRFNVFMAFFDAVFLSVAITHPDTIRTEKSKQQKRENEKSSRHCSKKKSGERKSKTESFVIP
jgi:hypothetical protein